ncbi:MAG: hypothetical protein QGI45_14185 [Myxococcota bacterium]|jgi:hypothetical protein|nr:hypothetical protein [Myxococcota bacterium]
MPCDDITEWVEVELNASDCLKNYSLNKRTCGAEIGNQSFLLKLFAGQSVNQILEKEPIVLLEEVDIENETDEFFALKHLFALQETLSSFIGITSSAPEASCAIAQVDYSDEQTHISAALSIVALTEKIKSCGACGSCGKNKKRQP